MSTGAIIFVIILLIAAIPITVLGLTLLTPSTREMLPPLYSIPAMIALTSTVGLAGYFLL